MTVFARLLLAAPTFLFALTISGCGSDRHPPSDVSIEATMVKGYLPSAPITRTALERPWVSCQMTPFCTAVEEGGRGIRITVEPLGQAEFEGVPARGYLRTWEYTQHGKVTYGPYREWLYFADNPFRLVGRESQGEYTVYDTVAALPTVTLVGRPPQLNWESSIIVGEFVRGTTYADKTKTSVKGGADVTWRLTEGDGSFVRVCFTFRSLIIWGDRHTSGREDCFAVDRSGDVTGFRTVSISSYQGTRTFYE